MTATKFLFVPVGGASQVFFRVGFGVIMLWSLLRFVSRGWVRAYYLEPTFHFTYPGLGWIKPWVAYGLPEWTLYGHVALLCVCCVAITFGVYYRWACALFFVGFTYLELIDKTFYLNHYYAISLLALLMCFLPLDQSLSWKVPALKPLPRWSLYILRFQVGLIYFFAGIAKINGDWLIQGEPLRRWLPALHQTPLLGGLFLIPAAAWIMSWVGMLFDVSIPFLMLSSRWRGWAYGSVLVFHLLTALLFPIGLFPWLMMFAALIFFAPDWPVRIMPRALKGWLETRNREETKPDSYSTGRGLRPVQKLFFGVFLMLQVLMPLRHHLYAGSVLWNELGFRFAWHVMLIEKTGWVEFTVKDPVSGRFWIETGDDLTAFQRRMMSMQPDMIVQYARHLAERKQPEFPALEVYAEAYASLNGRPSQLLIDPAVNLRHVYWRQLPSVIVPLQPIPPLQ